MEVKTMKKLVTLILALICVAACAIGLAACGKELNCLKVVDADTEQLKQEINLGTFSSDQLDELKAKLAELKFVFEYYPDKSTKDADMSKVKTKHFYSDGQGNAIEGQGIPTTLQQGTSYSLYYYYEGHEPTADYHDALSVHIMFLVSDN